MLAVAKGKMTKARCGYLVKFLLILVEIHYGTVKLFEVKNIDVGWCKEGKKIRY